MEHVVRMSEKPFQFLSAACILFAALIFLRVLAALVTDFRFIDEVTNGLLLNTQVGTTLIVLFILSVMGEFVIRVFVSAQGEPLYIVRKRLRKPGGR
jgi:hypothetical protein